MSLKTLEVIEEAVKKRPSEIAEARKNGRKVVGWFGYNIPEELLFALGLVPVRLGHGGDGRLVNVGSSYISSKNCVFTRHLVGEFAEKKDPYILNSDIVAVDSTCIQLYRVSEIIRYYFDVKTVCLGVPRNFYLPEARKYFMNEVKEFASKLEEFAGTKLETERFAASIELFNGIRDKIQKLYERQAAKGAGISWFEVYDAVQAGYYLDRERYSEYLSALLDELDTANTEPVEDVSEGARVFLSGSVIPPSDRKLIDIIGEFRGRIVGDDLWSGLAPSLSLDIKEPTLEGLADAYIDRFPHGALPYLDLETDRRLENLRVSIDKYQANGVIYHTLRYCDPFSFKANETKKVVGEDGIPLLEIHTEYAGSDIEAMRTRTEAFMEILRTD
jgi:benzoyl-CoA reductase/2-hydroxyglutaryl-CoA dehydratase subunit BcrC/BadD/HgdB